MSIGSVFRYFRQTKHITLKSASQDIVSIPFLSRFENGKTDISCTHLLALLNRINVQLSEFEFLYQKQQLSEFDLLPAFQHAYQNGEVEKIKIYLQKWQKIPGQFASLQCLQLKMMLATLDAGSVSPAELKRLVAYFQKLDNWTFFELYLFGHSIPFLSLPTMLNLFTELQKQEIIYDDFRHDNFSILFYIYNNVILCLLDHGQLTNASMLVDHLTAIFAHRDKDYYHRTRIFNLKGLTLYLQGKKKLGLRLIKRANLITYLVQHETRFITNEKNYLAKYLTPAELRAVFDLADDV
ncbi:MAG: helix-turn-helix domain-containing protein [Lactobacillus sp.]